jgi:hypothetical protein
VFKEPEAAAEMKSEQVPDVVVIGVSERLQRIPAKWPNVSG